MKFRIDILVEGEKKTTKKNRFHLEWTKSENDNNTNKKHSKNADTSTSVTFDLDV